MFQQGSIRRIVGVSVKAIQLHFDHVWILEIFTSLGSKNIPLY